MTSASKSTLTGISCTSASTCQAVGYATPSTYIGLDPGAAGLR
jgi:hypothetical protein